MAAIPGITTTAEIASIMQDASILPQILDPNEPQFTHQLLSWYVDPLRYGRSETVRFPRELSGDELDENNMSYENPVVEDDDAGYGTPIVFELGDVEATGQMIGARRRISFKSVHAGGLELARVVRNTEIILMKRVARDQAALGTSADNIGDNSGIVLTRQIFGREKAKFENQHPTGPYAAVLTPGQVESLKTDIRSDASAMVVNDPEMRELFRTMGAFVGYLEGVPIFRGEFQPDFDASNDFGYFATVGEGGALGIGQFFAQDQVEAGIANGFKYEIDWVNNNDYWDLWVKAYVAHAITNEENYRGLASKKISLA
jgi:hypothetical protein